MMNSKTKKDLAVTIFDRLEERELLNLPKALYDGYKAEAIEIITKELEDYVIVSGRPLE